MHGPYNLGIKVKEGVKLPMAKQRRFNRGEALEVKKQLDQLLKDGKTRTSRSESGWNKEMVHGLIDDSLKNYLSFP